MRNIALKEISIKLIIFLLVILLIFLINSGCSTKRNMPEDDLNVMVSAVLQTGTDGSGQRAGTISKTPESFQKDSFNKTKDSNQAYSGDKSEFESTSKNENTTAPESISINESSTTIIDEDKILFSFVVSGDNRPESNESPQPDVFFNLVEYMKQQNPLFYINAGDIIMGTTENEKVIKWQFEDYLVAKSKLGVLNFVAPGNHDVANDTSRKYFLELILNPVFNNAGVYGIDIHASLPLYGLTSADLQCAAIKESQAENEYTKNSFYYYFEYDDVYFIILNAYEKGQWGLIWGDQLLWLEELLYRLKDKKVFVFLHPPPYSILNPDCITDGSIHIAFSSKENQDHVRNIFSQFNVDGVFSGHNHLYNMQEHDGVHYIITGGSGSMLYAPPDKGGFYHFLNIQVKTKSWIMDVIDSSGSKLDHHCREIFFN